MDNKTIVEKIKSRVNALTITIGNQKGGVGKTTNATIIGYMLAKKGLHTLVADLDPQSNATKSLMLTRSANKPDDISTISKTLMKGIQDKDLTDLPVEIIHNLDLLPSFIDFEDFPKYLYKHTDSEYEEDHLIAPLFASLKKRYDVILIDVPPMSLEVTQNAVVMSDYVLISLQTQERSLTGAENYIATIAKIQKRYNLSVDIIGILQVLHRNHGSVDKFIMENARKEFGGDSLFKIVVPQMERIKRFDVNGITENDRFDKRVIAVYNQVTDELIQRIGEFEY